jgi:4-hydroxy-tetrahydrodipicolinate reductase
MAHIRIMINGLPGNMASLVAEYALKDGRFELLPVSLTGPEINDDACSVGGLSFGLVRPDARQEAVEKLQRQSGPFICVDYTHPSAVHANAEFYCRNRLPFVMGTTGGNRERLAETVRESDTAAVVAPNMAKQIVGFQAMMAHAAETFPGLFDGYTLSIRESHQQGKADTSGTAKAMVAYFNRLGTPFSESDIVKERSPEVQEREWGVPASYLGGHGWHTYSLVSPDQSVRFEFTHNVNGRDVYVHGTLSAVAFLKGKIDQGKKGRIYSMIDVLKGTQ